MTGARRIGPIRCHAPSQLVAQGDYGRLVKQYPKLEIDLSY
jgi:hypothetical protein